MGPVASPVIPDRPVGREQRAGRGTPNGSPARCANPLADKLTRNGSVTLLVPLDPYVLTLAPRPLDLAATPGTHQWAVTAADRTLWAQ